VRLERNGIRKTLIAEKIISLQKVAVKNIPGLILEKTFFSGAAIMPDGKPAMIISPERLIC
jgi:chemotaxis protein histidine kinase CheA